MTTGVEVLRKLLPTITADREVPYDRIFGELLGDRQRRVPLHALATSTASSTTIMTAELIIHDNGRHADGTRNVQLAPPTAVSEVDLLSGVRALGTESDPGRPPAASTEPPAAVGCSIGPLEQYDITAFPKVLEHITSGRFVTEVQSPVSWRGVATWGCEVGIPANPKDVVSRTWRPGGQVAASD